MEEGSKRIEKEILEGEPRFALQASAETLPSTEFVTVEKNLASLGFFTPSSKRLRNAQEKAFTITTIVDGQRVELKGTIIPSAKYGLPITADQDKWIALSEILTNIMRKKGRVTNPVAFTSAEILRLLHKHRHSGKNYREIEEWLDVLFSTTIFSEGVVYLAKEKRRIKDRYRVCERAVSFGKELSDGRRADKNYIWFSEWQLQNINNNHLLPIDLEAYRELKNHIAKALVLLLQVWLYATRRDGVYEKRYDELCQFLNIQRYRYKSLIRRTLGPSLDELKQFGYLSAWQIAKTSDGDNYKIVFYHGEKFHRDRRTRLARKRVTDNSLPADSGALKPPSQFHGDPQQPPVPVGRPAALAMQPSFDPALVGELTKRGITEKKAHELLANLKPGQTRNLIAQLEYAEQTVKELHGTPSQVRNPAGFIISMIERNAALPDGFETVAQRQAREERERQERARRDAAQAKQQLEYDYEDYCEAEVDRYIAQHGAEFEALKEAKWKYDREHYAFTTESVARIQARNEIRQHLTVLTFEEFVERKKRGSELPMNQASPSSVVEPEAAVPDDLLVADERREAQRDATDPVSEVPPRAAAEVPASEPSQLEPLIIELVADPPEEEIGGPAIGEAA